MSPLVSAVGQLLPVIPAGIVFLAASDINDSLGFVLSTSVFF